MSKDPFDGWQKTTLWFKLGVEQQVPMEFDVCLPPGLRDDDRQRIIDKLAAQCVVLIRTTTGDDRIIVQGAWVTVQRLDGAWCKRQ